MRAEAVTSASPPLDSFRQTLASSIDEGKLKLPMLPKVAGEVLSLVNDPDVDISELSALIHRDQALAGHVLRIANSAAFGGGERIVSLQQAITRLGMKLIGEVALALSLQGEVFAVKGFEKETKQIWRHALASSVYGKEAARMKRTNVEGQFLCGLLHTFGKPVLLQACAEWNHNRKPSLERDAAMSVVEEFHGQVGERLAEEWKLPQQVRVCCAYYSKYNEAPAFENEVAMTYLADRLASWLVAPVIVPETDLQSDPVFERLNFYPDDVEALLAKKEEILNTVDSMEL